MADTPKVEPKLVVKEVLEGPGGVVAAPLFYVDWLGARGITGGVVNVTLCAHKYLATDDGAGVATREVVPHLRMPLHTAKALEAALKEADLLSQPAASDEKN